MVVGQGFEPWKAMPTDLQSVRIGYKIRGFYKNYSFCTPVVPLCCCGGSCVLVSLLLLVSISIS